MASFTAEQFRTLMDAMKLIESALEEDIFAPQPSLPPDLKQFITKYPEVVANDPKELLPRLIAHAKTGARFDYVFALLPDGRYLETTRRPAQKWGLKIVGGGDHESLLGL